MCFLPSLAELLKSELLKALIYLTSNLKLRTVFDMQEDNRKLYGVIGYPLGHSFGPLLHNWGFKKHNLQNIYLKWEIPPRDLGAFVVSLHTLSIQGISVTLPYKQKIIPYLDEITPEAKKIGAVNTVYWNASELWGENTDWFGFLQPLQNMNAHIDNALILGAGGAALACIVGLQNMGVSKIYVAARRKERLQDLEKRFQIVPVDWQEKTNFPADLLVNSTPLGMSGDLESSTPFEGNLEAYKYVYDLVYNPIQTRLLHAAASSSNCTAVSGLYMFIYQALKQFHIWTGYEFPVDEAEALLRKHL